MRRDKSGYRNWKGADSLKGGTDNKGNSEYSNIEINKIDSMQREPNCPFVLYVGAKRLGKRKEFEIFLSEKLVIWTLLAIEKWETLC